MKMLPDTVVEYSERAAQEFLQTVVFIDDRIYEHKSGFVVEPKKVLTPKQRKKATRSAENTISKHVVSNDLQDTNEYSPQDIVMSFAKKKIICSLYQPKKDAKVLETLDIFHLCLAADIVIVDWVMDGDNGDRALELIKRLIFQAVNDVPEQLRLILVYTQEIDLSDIANRLYQTVSVSIGEGRPPLQEESSLAFHTLNSRVVILGKAGRARSQEYSDHVVESKDLADVAVKQFAKLASGLLHAAVLFGLAGIRQNSRKILSKFNVTLDPAFLTHRAMSLPEEDASTHIVSLLVSEIESVLEDVLPTPLIPEQILRDWCQKVWQPCDHVDDLLGNNSPNKRTIAEAICLKGFKAAKTEYSQIPNPNGNKNVRKAAKILLSGDDDKSNHLFSHLMASRTFYSKMQKSLKLGSIVYDKNGDRYFLCIQPVCDSVRLDNDKVFVFVQLTKTDPSSGNQASHVVVKEDTETIELFYQAKSYQCYVAIFSPDPHAKQVITRVSRKTGEPVFVDKSRRCYVWIDQLKPSHAQRAVEKFARDLSRVGLTESEWLRMLEKK